MESVMYTSGNTVRMKPIPNSFDLDELADKLGQLKIRKELADENPEDHKCLKNWKEMYNQISRFLGAFGLGIVWSFSAEKYYVCSLD